jgi:hypothetical protein
MIGSCAFFYSILLSDMSGDKAGPKAVGMVFGIWIFVLLLMMSILIYRLRRYVIWSKYSLGDSLITRYCKMAHDTWNFFWDSFASNDVELERINDPLSSLDSQVPDSSPIPAPALSVSEIRWTSNKSLNIFSLATFDAMKGVSKPTSRGDSSVLPHVELQTIV